MNLSASNGMQVEADPGPAASQDRLGDGNFARRYPRADPGMAALWSVAVCETRELLDSGWERAAERAPRASFSRFPHPGGSHA